MNDFQTYQQADSEPAPAPEPSALLREAREAAGLHIATVAAALKVPVKKLEALEAGRYDELPDLTFARALAASACRQCKIDPAPVLAQIPLANRPSLADSPQAINEPFKGESDPVSFSPAGWLSRPAVLAAIALLLGALVLVFLPTRETPTPVEAVMPPAAVPTAPVAETSTGAALAPAQPQTQTVESVPSSSGEATSLPANSAVSATPTAAAVVNPPVAAAPVTDAPGTAQASATTPAPDGMLSIKASGASWVEVLKGTREVVVRRMLQAGEVIDVPTGPLYTVVIGRTDVVQVTVRGKPFDLSPFARSSVARFEVQ